MVIALIKAGQFTAFPDALRFLLAVRAAGIPVAAASSSKNAGLLLSRVRVDTFAEEHGLDYDFIGPGKTVLDVLDADISGRTFGRGKPHPEISLTAASELGAPATGASSSKTRSPGSRPPRPAGWLRWASPEPTTYSS